MSTERSRQAAGQRTGGQFKAEQHAESSLELNDPWGDFIASREGVEKQPSDGSENWQEIDARDATDYVSWLKTRSSEHGEETVAQMVQDYQFWMGRGYPRTSAREMADRGIGKLPDLSMQPPWHENEDEGGDQDVAEAREAYRKAKEALSVSEVYYGIHEGEDVDLQSLKGIPGFEEINFERVKEFTDKWDAITEEEGNLEDRLEELENEAEANSYRGEEDEELDGEIGNIQALIDEREADARAMGIEDLQSALDGYMEGSGLGLDLVPSRDDLVKEKAEGLRRALFYRGLGAEARLGPDMLDARQWVQPTRISQENPARLPAVPDQYQPDLDS